MERRVPKCKIEFVCRYRTDLCQMDTGCRGHREPENRRMVVDGEFASVEEKGKLVRYRLSEDAKNLMVMFDRGESEEALPDRFSLLAT